MADEKATLLIVEDDLDVAEMLNAYFRVQGYEVVTVNWGEDGVRAAGTHHPGLIILDIRLPDIDGYEVARRLRQDRHTQDIPIIFLTEKRERADRLKGLELQADDYLTKPFDVQELRLRVRNVLHRNAQSTLTNPVTGLPEGNLVDERLSECLSRQDWTILAISLYNVSRFRELYGFVASDDLLRAVCLMMREAMHEAGSPFDFLGQVGPSNFILVAEPDGAGALAERISKRIDQSIDYFYRDQDRVSEARRGTRLSVVVGELRPESGSFDTLEQLKEHIIKPLR